MCGPEVSPPQGSEEEQMGMNSPPALQQVKFPSSGSRNAIKLVFMISPKDMTPVDQKLSILLLTAKKNINFKTISMIYSIGNS